MSGHKHSSTLLPEIRRQLIRFRYLRRLKSHFSSLLDTISFTLYALLPTLSPQLTSAYPVEETSGLLQGISNPSSSVASIGATPDTTPANSLLLQGEQEVSVREEEPSSASPPGSGTSGISTSVSGPTSAVGESWASEFQNQSHERTPDQDQSQDLPARESMEGSEAFSLAHAEGDDGVSVTSNRTHHACHRISSETEFAALVLPLDRADSSGVICRFSADLVATDRRLLVLWLTDLGSLAVSPTPAIAPTRATAFHISKLAGASGPT